MHFSYGTSFDHMISAEKKKCLLSLIRILFYFLIPNEMYIVCKKLIFFSLLFQCCCQCGSSLSNWTDRLPSWSHSYWYIHHPACSRVNLWHWVPDCSSSSSSNPLHSSGYLPKWCRLNHLWLWLWPNHTDSSCCSCCSLWLYQDLLRTTINCNRLHCCRHTLPK